MDYSDIPLRKLEQKVLEYFTIVKRATLLDVQWFFHDHGSTFRTRVADLVKKGILRDSGKVEWQTSPNKKRQTKRTVWELVPRPEPAE